MNLSYASVKGIVIRSLQWYLDGWQIHRHRVRRQESNLIRGHLLRSATLRNRFKTTPQSRYSVISPPTESSLMGKRLQPIQQKLIIIGSRLLCCYLPCVKQDCCCVFGFTEISLWFTWLNSASVSLVVECPRRCSVIVDVCFFLLS